MQDCCGTCPAPITDEEHELSREESKRYVSGPLEFIVDDPGRQEVGSFNPTTDDEFTTMAYISDTDLLCQAIVDGNLAYVNEWCSRPDIDVNDRDFTGRTPLHLAVLSSTSEVVRCLVEHGARLIARLVDGRTALHLAASRGDPGIIKILMNKSLSNEEEEAHRVEARRGAKRPDHCDSADGNSDATSEASEISAPSDDVATDAMSMGSFVKIGNDHEQVEVGTTICCFVMVISIC